MERLLKYFTPTDYQIEEYIFRDTELVQGTVKVRGVVVDKNTVKFHAVNMEIKEVSFCALHWGGTAFVPDDWDEIKRGNYAHQCQYSYDNETITITVDDTMHRDLDAARAVNMEEDFDDRYLAEFTIKYETKLNHNMQGCYLSTYTFHGQEKRLVATQFESHYAREAFPCIDEPAAKAVFNLTLIVPDRTPEDVILANTPVILQDINRFEFEPTPRMSTYLLAWVIGPLKCVSAVNNHGVKVASYAALNQSTSSLEFANEVAVRALDYYDEKFGVKYPLPKLDQVALPDFEAGAMENWGLVTYRESCMLAEPNSSIDTKQSVAVTVTHELSHQWFGDLVTMAWWDDLWLNESFATIMEYYATDALYPELNAWQDFYTGDCVAALRRDSLPGVQAVQQAVHDPAEIATLFDSAIVYAKGARLVLMLMHLMGEDNFYKGVHDYFVKYKYQNTVGDDLWYALQKYADFDIKDFMHAWISQPGYPALQQAHNGDKTFWDQQRFLINGTTDDTKWPLPEVKDDMSGHYLLDLSTADFESKLKTFDTLSLEQKLRLLIDRMMLAKAALSPSASLLDLLPKFVGEDAPVWDILLSIINDLKIFCPDGSESDTLYRKFLRTTIAPRAHELGVVSQPDDSSNEKRLRKVLAVVARFSREPVIIGQLADLYCDDLSMIDPEMRGNVLMAKMLRDEAEIFPELLAKYQSTHDPELRDDILGALSIVERPDNIKAVLALLNQPEIVRPQDHLFLYIYLLRNPKSRAKTLAWLYENWGYIEKLTGDKSIEDYPRCTANYIDTRAEADAFYSFFDKLSDRPVLKRTLAMAKVSIESKLSLIERESSAIHNKLQELIKEKRK